MQLHLMMGIFWLIVGIAVAAANIFGTDVRGATSEIGRLFGMGGFVLAVYNFVRYWAARTRQKARDAAAAEPPRKRIIDQPPAEYNPELDFTQPDPPTK
jgi:hypothetical protein